MIYVLCLMKNADVVELVDPVIRRDKHANYNSNAGMAELVDAHASGACRISSCGSSNLPSGTVVRLIGDDSK